MVLFLVYKNGDMTGGWGPMVLDSIFLNRSKAENYIDDKPGVMGCIRQWSKEEYGDWKIEEIATKD